MVEPRILQNYGKLYIWTFELNQLKALQSNLFKRPPLSNGHCWVRPSKFPFNRYYLTQPATTFLTPKWKKNFSKTIATKTLSGERIRKKNIRNNNNIYKINVSLITFTLLLIYNANLFNVYKSWTIYKIM